MLNLAEYRKRPTLLADYLPWAALVAPGVVLNKDGSFQRSFRFRGPDLESATEAELVAVSARVNNVLRRFGSGWALFFEAERRPAPGYPVSEFPDPASRLVDAERRAAFEGETSHFESAYHLTLTHLPPPDPVSRAGRLLLERSEETREADHRGALEAFITETERAADLLSGLLPEFAPLDDGETLTYLHGTISTRRHPVAVPDIPMYLDGVLADTPLAGGLEPMLGERHLRAVTVLGFPGLTRPGLLDGLNRLGFSYRWMTRFIALDKTTAVRTLTRLRRQWFAKRKSLTALLREVLYNEPTQLLDTDADNKVADTDAALEELGGDDVAFGYLTVSIVVSDETREAAAEKLRAVERVITGRGFAAIAESLNAVEAWLGSLPGQVYANVRRPLVHTFNLAHLMPLSAVWAGPAGNAHLGGPPLMLAETGGSTPFRLSTHVGDVGHMMVVGPTGAGKSVLLALIALQFRRYGHAEVTLFDKGGSARAAVLAMGGRWHALGSEDMPAFQPLRRIDAPARRARAAEWVAGLLAHEGVAVTPEVKEALWSALGNLADAPEGERTLTGLSVLLQSNPLKSALAPWTLEGPFGRLLDGAEDLPSPERSPGFAQAGRLALSDVQGFEMEALMAEPGAVLPVLTHLFDRLEERFDGRPALLILDEAWLFLDHRTFAARLRDWLKTLRKKNVAVVFATQSLADIASSSIAPALIESCPQRIFLPDARAMEPQAREAYLRFGLNDRQIGLIAGAAPKRDYYLQSRRGNRLFELGLGSVTRAFCAASSSADQALIDRVLERAGPERFAAAWLRAKGLGWAAELIASSDEPSPENPHES